LYGVPRTSCANRTLHPASKAIEKMVCAMADQYDEPDSTTDTESYILDEVKPSFYD